tara:strand:- start:1016 stop:1288 length:273 start_codon:yes stop_codon:yes gene_type:complete
MTTFNDIAAYAVRFTLADHRAPDFDASPEDIEDPMWAENYRLPTAEEEIANDLAKAKHAVWIASLANASDADMLRGLSGGPSDLLGEVTS